MHVFGSRDKFGLMELCNVVEKYEIIYKRIRKDGKDDREDHSLKGC
jgi:hypothetical protein